MSVFYDGKYLCVSIARGKHEVVLRLATEAEYFEYLDDVGIYCLPPTKRTARTLYEAGYHFDNSARFFIDPNIKKSQAKEPKHSSAENPLFDKLYPFQRKGVLSMLAMKKNILLADEMGLGKTVQALMFLSMKENALPALIVCPASLKYKWAEEVEKWVGVSAYVIEGKEPQSYSDEFLRKYPIWIINYDILGIEDARAKAREIEERKNARAAGRRRTNRLVHVLGWCDSLPAYNFSTIIADEVQYIGDSETIRTRALTQICSSLKDSRKLFISGTPYETKTAQFYNALSILSPTDFSSKYQFLMRYCDPQKTFFGWRFDGLSNAEELRWKIEKFMIRRLKKDVLTDLPPKQRVVMPMHISEKLRKEYDDFDNQFVLDIKNGKKKKTDQLGHLAHLKQKAFECKKKAIIQWVREYLSYQNKLVIFVYHRNTFDILMDVFGKAAVGIMGDISAKDRLHIEKQFQTDPNIKLFAGQIRACGAGITLTASCATCFVEFGATATQHEQAEDRVHRIGQKSDSVMAYYLVLNNSIETDLMTTLNRRNRDIKKLMDNEENAELFSDAGDFNESVLLEYKRRKNLIK